MLGTRGLRALAACLVVALCGSGAHLLAGGHVAAFVPLLVALVAWPVALASAGQRLGTGQLLGLLVLGQVVTHALAGHAPADGGAMLLAHVGATAASLVILRRGEDAWWQVAEALGMVLARVRPVTALVVPTSTRVHAGADHWVPSPVARVAGDGQRAPPVGS